MTTMTNKRALALIAAAMIAAGLPAQSVDDVKKQINNIKRNTSVYLYGEATAQTPEDARNMAEGYLYDEINQWAATKKRLKGSKNFIVNNREEYSLQYLSTTRGNMYRSFVFVRKSDVAKGDNAAVVGNTSPGAPQGGMVSTVEPLQPASAEQGGEKVFAIPAAVSELAEITEYGAMAESIMKRKERGDITEYDRYGKLTHPDDYYMAVYNREGKVVAVLTKGAQRVNVKTGKADSLANYKGCGAIGFKVKE